MGVYRDAVNYMAGSSMNYPMSYTYDPISKKGILTVYGREYRINDAKSLNNLKDSDFVAPFDDLILNSTILKRNALIGYCKVFKCGLIGQTKDGGIKVGGTAYQSYEDAHKAIVGPYYLNLIKSGKSPLDQSGIEKAQIKVPVKAPAPAKSPVPKLKGKGKAPAVMKANAAPFIPAAVKIPAPAKAPAPVKAPAPANPSGDPVYELLQRPVPSKDAEKYSQYLEKDPNFGLMVVINDCRPKTQKCKQIYLEYKDVCDGLWGAECHSNMSIQELNDNISKAIACVEKRKNYSNSCCDGTIDLGHIHAIRKMNIYAIRCRYIRDEKLKGTSEEIEEMINKRLKMLEDNIQLKYELNKKEAKIREELKELKSKIKISKSHQDMDLINSQIQDIIDEDAKFLEAIEAIDKIDLSMAFDISNMNADMRLLMEKEEENQRIEDEMMEALKNISYVNHDPNVLDIIDRIENINEQNNKLLETEEEILQYLENAQVDNLNESLINIGDLRQKYAKNKELEQRMLDEIDSFALGTEYLTDGSRLLNNDILNIIDREDTNDAHLAMLAEQLYEYTDEEIVYIPPNKKR
jgi:hypothetical protein